MTGSDGGHFWCSKARVRLASMAPGLKDFTRTLTPDKAWAGGGAVCSAGWGMVGFILGGHLLHWPRSNLCFKGQGTFSIQISCSSFLVSKFKQVFSTVEAERL